MPAQNGENCAGEFDILSVSTGSLNQDNGCVEKITDVQV